MKSQSVKVGCISRGLSTAFNIVFPDRRTQAGPCRAHTPKRRTDRSEQVIFDLI